MRAAGRTLPSAGRNDTLWAGVERILAGAAVEGIRVHKLGALAARYRRLRGQPVPRTLAGDERGAAVAMLLSRPLLERIRSACDGPLLLIKGPEVALLYPGQARVFADLDLLVPDPSPVQRALAAAGFVDAGRFFEEAHHLRPLQFPGLGLKVEVHRRPSWPKLLTPPRLDEILEGAVPAACGVEGIVAPDPRHHALILAAHGWKENPLGTMRDLIDVAAVSAGASEQDLERLAAAWGLDRVWRATRSTTEALLEGSPLSLPARLWARHLESVRERTVLEDQLRAWLQGFSKLPPRLALQDTRDALRRKLRRAPEESWRQKLLRAAHAVSHPRQPHSVHLSESRRDSAAKGRDGHPRRR